MTQCIPTQHNKKLFFLEYKICTLALFISMKAPEMSNKGRLIEAMMAYPCN
jgi:hypothetical protein